MSVSIRSRKWKKTKRNGFDMNNKEKLELKRNIGLRCWIGLPLGKLGIIFSLTVACVFQCVSAKLSMSLHFFGKHVWLI